MVENLSPAMDNPVSALQHRNYGLSKLHTHLGWHRIRQQYCDGKNTRLMSFYGRI